MESVKVHEKTKKDYLLAVNQGLGNTTPNIHVWNIMYYWLVVEPTHLKNMLVKLGLSSPNRDENKKYLKPPARLYILITTIYRKSCANETVYVSWLLRIAKWTWPASKGSVNTEIGVAARLRNTVCLNKKDACKFPMVKIIISETWFLVGMCWQYCHHHLSYEKYPLYWLFN